MNSLEERPSLFADAKVDGLRETRKYSAIFFSKDCKFYALTLYIYYACACVRWGYDIVRKRKGKERKGKRKTVVRKIP